jgi:hypothetical protein
VDGHRRYADEPEPSWYTGQSPTPNTYDSGVHDRPSGAFRLPDQRPADAYPPPYAPIDPVTSSGSHALPPQDTGTRMPVRGPEYPTIRPNSGGTSPADPSSPISAASTTYGAPGGTYGGPASGMPAPGLPAPGLPGPGLPPTGSTHHGPAPAGDPTTVVPSISRFGPAPAESVYKTRRPISAVVFAGIAALLMVPVVLLLIRVTFVDDPTVRGIVPAVLLTLGLPLTGLGLYQLAAGGAATSRETWLRPPVAYLPIGLFLLLTAGLAVA